MKPLGRQTKYYTARCPRTRICWDCYQRHIYLTRRKDKIRAMGENRTRQKLMNKRIIREYFEE